MIAGGMTNDSGSKLPHSPLEAGPAEASRIGHALSFGHCHDVDLLEP